MLTKEDFHQNLRAISVGCKLAAFPLYVDLRTGRLQVAQSKLMETVCWVFFACYTLHIAYIVLRLPYLLLMGPKIPLPSLLWHFTLFVGTPLVAFSHYTAFFRWPGLTVTCFKTVFDTWECEQEGNASKCLSKACNPLVKMSKGSLLQ